MIAQVPVTVTYRDDKVTVTGPGITATVEITAKELKKMYWGKLGAAKLTITQT